MVNQTGHYPRFLNRYSDNLITKTYDKLSTVHLFVDYFYKQFVNVKKIVWDFRLLLNIKENYYPFIIVIYLLK